MPKKLEDCLRKVKKNSPDVNEYAVCSKSTGYKVGKGSTKHHKKWVKEENAVTPTFDSIVENYMQGFDKEAADLIKQLGAIKEFDVFKHRVDELEHADVSMLKRLLNMTDMIKGLKGFGMPKWYDQFYKAARRFYHNTNMDGIDK